MFASAAGMANEPKLRKESDSKNLVLEMDAQNNQTSVKFIDAEGNVIFTDTNSFSESYIKKFNLATLPEGTYYLEIENETKELVYTINIDSETVGIGEKKESLKPVFRRNNKKVRFNLLNLDRGAVEIKVLDSDNRIVFEEVSEEMAVQKVFDFATAPKDAYTIVINEGNDTYYENVVVK